MTVCVEEVLGVRPQPVVLLPAEPAQGVAIDVTVIGGQYSAQLSPEAAEALGMSPSAAESLTFSVASGIALTEGDRAILFLRYDPLVDALPATYWIAGDAAWVIEGGKLTAASSAVKGSDPDLAQLRALGRAIGAQLGNAQDPVPDSSRGH